MVKWIGVDESGKGDYFGYLVIAGVIVDKEKERELREIGVKDSKNMLDTSVMHTATKIRKMCKHEVVKISPEKYNLLYRKLKNLNKLLAWGHARVIENLVKKEKVDYVVVDKFADEKVLRGMLFEDSRKVKIEQKIRAERDMAVAAASILARAEFLRTLKALSLEIGYKLPKGATHVEEAAKELLKKYDEKILDVVAKKHFKTTKRVIEKKK